VSEGAVVCFGEMLIRFSPPGQELLLQSPALKVVYGGAEANVAVGLSRLGRRARMVSVVPDNDLGRAAVGELRRWGVDVSGVRSGPGRMGLYFVTPGAALRSTEVLYDRAHSAFSRARAADFDWERELQGASWLHLSGITPALGSAGVEACVAAASVARARGVKVCFDGNYRANLWAERPGEAPAILRQLLSRADLALVNERDLALVLERDFPGEDELVSRADAAAEAFAAFPWLKRIAALLRSTGPGGQHQLAATMATRERSIVTEPLSLPAIVDRIGAGDAFAAGLLHGLLAESTEEAALASGLRSAAHKHGVPGDFSLATAADLANFDAPWTDVRR
jgi:2-dehydro-3-deoxygluconokinase